MIAGQLQMIALFGVCHAAAGEERAPQERSAAAVVLQYAEVDVQRQCLPGLVAELADNALQLAGIRDLKNQFFPTLLLFRQAVKAQVKRLVKQFRQPLGKLRIFRDDADLPCIERVAVQQHAVGFRSGAAAALHRHAA